MKSRRELTSMGKMTGDRLPGLDALRGIAALVVVVFHCMLVSPLLADAFRDGDVGGPWWLLNSPLRLFWAGTEAVMIFFLLSGFVLAVPFLREAARPSLSYYYPQRLLRLYLPVAGSLLLAGATYWAVNHTARPEMSWWMAGHDIDPDLGTAAHDFALLLGTGWFNSVLWSLRWEVLFSVLLPLVIVVMVRLNRLRIPVMVIGLVAIGVADWLNSSSIAYMMMFCMGSLLASERVRIHAYVTPLPRSVRAGLVAVALSLLIFPWWPTWDQAPGGSAAVVTVGAMMLLIAFVELPSLRSMSSTRSLAWLGTRSFSLYLVHEPVVVVTSLLIGGENALVVLAIALPLSLVLAAAFYRAVEWPSHRLARIVGRGVECRVPWRKRAVAPAVWPQSRRRRSRAGDPV